MHVRVAFCFEIPMKQLNINIGSIEFCPKRLDNAWYPSISQFSVLHNLVSHTARPIL